MRAEGEYGPLPRSDLLDKLTVIWRIKQQKKRSKKQLNWAKVKDPKKLHIY